MVENDGIINLSDFLDPQKSADPAPQMIEDVRRQLESPYSYVAADFNSKYRKPTLFEGFAASSAAEGLSEEDLDTTKRVMDSFEAIFKNEVYQEGTPQRRKFNTAIAIINNGAQYIKQINGSFQEGKFVSLNNGTCVDQSDPYVINMIKMIGANLYMDQIIGDQIESGREAGVGEHMEAAGAVLRENSFILVNRVEDGSRLIDFLDADSLIAEGRLADFPSLIFKRDEKPLGEADEDYHARNTLQSYLTIFAFLESDAIRNFRGKSPIEKESYKYAALFLDNVQRLREESLRALFNSEHPDHEGVSDVLAKALGNRETANISLLYIMSGNVSEMYRKTKRLMEVEEDSEIARLIMSAVDREIEKKGATLVKTNDLTEIGAKKLDEEHDYDAQRRRINEIFSNTSVSMYEFEGCEVESDLIVPPSQVNIRFEKGKPHIFDIELHYENEHGEESTMDYTIDCRKGEFEWSLLDDPEVESGFRNTFLKYADTVLEVVLEKAKQIKASKKKQEDFVPQSPARPRMRSVSSRPKRAPFEGRDEAKNIVSDLPLEPEPESVEEASISREIVIPNEDELKALLKKLDYMDRDIVMLRLQAFNERGVGRIQALKNGGNSRKSGAGNALGKYVISGRNGGGKGIRVLVERAGAIQGSETWSIVAVDYKANIYNGNRLDKI